MSRTILTCVGSSLLTVGLLSLMGAGPLNPPAGPVTPTGVSLDQLAGMVNTMTPGGTSLPGRTLTGGAGTVTIAFSDRTVEVPLIGYALTKPPLSAGVLSLTFEAGLYGGHMDYTGATPSFTIHGSDGTTIGPIQGTRNQRNLVNGPVLSGNKAIDTIYINVNGNIPISDAGGNGAF